VTGHRKFGGQDHRLSHRRRYRARMIPLDLVFALAPAALWLSLELAERLRR